MKILVNEVKQIDKSTTERKNTSQTVFEQTNPHIGNKLDASNKKLKSSLSVTFPGFSQDKIRTDTNKLVYKNPISKTLNVMFEEPNNTTKTIMSIKENELNAFSYSPRLNKNIATRTLFEYAIHYNQPEIVKHLLDELPEENLTAPMISNQIQSAVSDGKSEPVFILLNAMRKNADNNSVLANLPVTALKNEHIELANKLRSEVKDMNAFDEQYFQLHLANANKDVDEIERLLKENRNSDQAMKFVHYSIQNKNSDMVMLSKNYIDINAISNSETALTLAIDVRGLNVIKLLLEDQRLDINQVNQFGHSPKDKIEYLLEDPYQLLQDYQKEKQEVSDLFQSRFNDAENKKRTQDRNEKIKKASAATLSGLAVAAAGKSIYENFPTKQILKNVTSSRIREEDLIKSKL